ncbi:hypothetical protein B6U74_05405 [Candidatus Bathyarchaeota archaeon ex4484_205]|nr:MAG: hypothetical protein B6U74_05405 [Candidatus Bathyarchaeota archaeon ex4484_205]
MKKIDPKFAYWKGIPREEITWHPTVDESKCTGCGMCVTSCGRNVFDYDWEEGMQFTSLTQMLASPHTSHICWETLSETVRTPRGYLN